MRHPGERGHAIHHVVDHGPLLRADRRASPSWCAFLRRLSGVGTGHDHERECRTSCIAREKTVVILPRHPGHFCLHIVDARIDVTGTRQHSFGPIPTYHQGEEPSGPPQGIACAPRILNGCVARTVRSPKSVIRRITVAIRKRARANVSQ